MTLLQKICLAITILGGLNWGLIGLLDFNVVEAMFGDVDDSIIPRIIYSFIGLTALINIGILVMDLDRAKMIED
jgi:uncharacterized membrane protein YuzA (DUF378 family)